MNTDPPAFRLAGMVLFLLVAVARREAAASSLALENRYANGVEDRGNRDGSTFLPLYSALADPTQQATPALNRDSGFAAAGPSTTGLVGWWKLDETEGTVASDSSGNGHNGKLLNGPVWTTGPVRGALSFDGTNDQVTCTESPALSIAGDITIAFWVKKNAEAKQVSRLVGKGNVSARNYGIWEEGREEGSNSGRLLFQQLDSARQGINLMTTRKLAMGTWYHVAAVVQGSNVNFYVNGRLDASGIRKTPAPTTNDPLTFGYSGWNEHFAGVLDDVRIYNRALTSEEIVALYAEPDHRRASRPPGETQIRRIVPRSPAPVILERQTQLDLRKSIQSTPLAASSVSASFWM